MAKKKDQTEDRIVAVEEALSKTEQFIESKKNLLSYIVLGIVILVAAYLGYTKFILAPKEIDAQSQMFVAEQYFEKDSLELAIYGDGNYLGFIDIISEYRITKSANLAKYYLGICYLKQGDFDNAIKYLKKYKSKDKMVAPMAKGAIGDAYMELNETDKALEYYLKAAELNDNELTSPLFLMKAGWTYEILNDFEEAANVYEKIKQEFPRSFEARDIDKYIARAKGGIK